LCNCCWNSSDDPVDEVKAAKEIQSGYALPDGVSVNRFLLAFGTSTITSVTITTATSSITATCSSVCSSTLIFQRNINWSILILSIDRSLVSLPAVLLASKRWEKTYQDRQGCYSFLHYYLKYISVHKTANQKRDIKSRLCILLYVDDPVNTFPVVMMLRELFIWFEMKSFLTICNT